MAGASLLTLIDDIATLMDDVAVMSKVAVKKTAGVLGDDLAVNAEQVSGVSTDRELPVVWAVAKGSLLNKVILVPAALLISLVAPCLLRHCSLWVAHFSVSKALRKSTIGGPTEIKKSHLKVRWAVHK
ncbi:putative membrane protein [Vibrio astriarenae]|nr:putative membrane protein [Vibrio sp. C7]